MENNAVNLSRETKENNTMKKKRAEFIKRVFGEESITVNNTEKKAGRTAEIEALIEGARQVIWKLSLNYNEPNYKGPARITRQDATVRMLADALSALRSAGVEV